MSGPQFHQSGYGRTFFAAQLPQLITGITNIGMALPKLIKALDRHTDAMAKTAPDGEEPLLVPQSRCDYVLPPEAGEESLWVTVDGFSVRIARMEGAVDVAIWKKGDETADYPLDSCRVEE